MGHRSYLYLEKPASEKVLFEANNSLPFFWLALLDSPALRAKIDVWEKVFLEEDSLNEEEEPEPDREVNNLSLSKVQFRKNADRSLAFLEWHFPFCSPLFREFVDFINAAFDAEYTLEIAITQCSAFYESVQSFGAALLQEVEAIETDQPQKVTFLQPDDLIAGGTGFAADAGGAFEDRPAYQAALKAREKPEFKRAKPVPETALEFRPKSLIVASLILLLCPVFTFAVYRGYNKEGLSGMVIAVAFLNGLFYVFSVRAVIAGIKGRKKG